MNAKDIKRIEYRSGMLEKGAKSKDLPVKVWSAAKIPDEVKKAINDEGLLNLGGVYGDKTVGTPMEYDNLKMVLEDSTVEITFFNRGITLFISDDKRVRQVHRVLCKIEEIGEE